MAEVRDHNPPSGLRWVEGRCLSYGGSIAYLPWLDVLRGLLEMRADVPPLAARDTLRKQVQTLCPDHVDDVTPYLTAVYPIDRWREAFGRAKRRDSFKVCLQI